MSELKIPETDRRDRKIARVLILIFVLIILYWLGTGILKLYHWFVALGPYQSWWWSAIGHFLVKNAGIIIIIYTILALQSSGLAEMKFKKPFLQSFLLALILTPPLMLKFYGHKKTKDVQRGR